MKELNKAAYIAVRDCMAVKKEETILVITDPKRRNIGMLYMKQQWI